MRESVEAKPPAMVRTGPSAAPPPHRRRRRAALSVMPTLLTLGNLVAGFAAIHYAYKPLDPSEFSGPWGWTGLTLAAAMIFLGMFLDSLDGSVARLTRTFSERRRPARFVCRHGHVRHRAGVHDAAAGKLLPWPG